MTGNLDSFQMGVSQVYGRNYINVCESRVSDSVSKVFYSCLISVVLCPYRHVIHIHKQKKEMKLWCRGYMCPFHQFLFFTFQPPFSHTT